MSEVGSAKSLGDYTALIRRRWKYPVLIIPAFVLAAVFMAYMLPPTYKAVGTIMQQGSQFSSRLVPTSVNNVDDIILKAAEQLQLTRRRIMTTERLKEIVERVDPYPGVEGMSAKEKAESIAANTEVERVDPVTYEPDPGSTSFSIYYYHPDPVLAAKIDNELVNLFVEYNRQERTEQATDALEFLQAQARDLESTMSAMEKKLAAFKAKHPDSLPGQEARTLVGVDRAQRDLETLERDIRSSEEKESLLELQLHDTSPSLMAAVGDWRTELAKLRAELSVAEQKYTGEHPEVKRLRRAIADAVANGNAAESVTRGKPDNPEYLRLQKQLESVQRELVALRASAARTRNEMSGFEHSLATSPDVEREYLVLTRDYENSQNRYQDLQTKIKEAALSRDVESQQRGERFTRVREAFPPTRPDSPNRIGIILIGFMLGVGLAILLAVLVDASDPTVRSVEDLEDILQTSPMGAVPAILNMEDKRRRFRTWGTVSAAYTIAIIVVALTVSFAT
jgi:polysaccharide biosynthesis transport protein